MHSPLDHFTIILSLATDVTDVTLGEASGLWIGTRTGAGGTATLVYRFLGRSPMAPWTTGQSAEAFPEDNTGTMNMLIQSIIPLDTTELGIEHGSSKSVQATTLSLSQTAGRNNFFILIM